MTLIEEARAILAEHRKLPPWQQAHQPHVAIPARTLAILLDRVPEPVSVSHWDGGEV